MIASERMKTSPLGEILHERSGVRQRTQTGVSPSAIEALLNGINRYPSLGNRFDSGIRRFAVSQPTQAAETANIARGVLTSQFSKDKRYTRENETYVTRRIAHRKSRNSTGQEIRRSSDPVLSKSFVVLGVTT